MLWAMGLTAFLCFFIGVYPKALYDLLPFKEAAAEYHPYNLPASLGNGSAPAFYRAGIFPAP